MAKSDIGSGFNLPLSSLVLYATYIMRTIHVSNRSVLTDLRDLLSMVDPNKNYSEVSFSISRGSTQRI